MDITKNKSRINMMGISKNFDFRLSFPFGETGKGLLKLIIEVFRDAMNFKSMTYKFKYLLFISIMIMAGCARKTGIIAPREYYLKPVFDSDISTINLIAEFPTIKAEQLINAKIPDVIYEDTNIDDDNYTVKVNKRGSFTLEPQGEYIYINAPLRIDAKAQINMGFIKADQSGSFDLDVKFRLRFGLTKNWEITTEAVAAGFNWITEPKVKVGPLEISVAPFLEKMLVSQQSKINDQIDKMISKAIDLKPLVEESWKYLQRPIPISNEVNAWTTIKPDEIYYIPINGSTQTIKLGLGIKARLETTIGAKPSFENTSLPSLSMGKNADSLFTIHLISRIGFKEASDYAKNKLIDTPISFENEKHTVKINDILFYGSGNTLVVKTLLSGDYNGWVYFSGIPYYDSATSTVRIKSLDFTAESVNVLNKTYSWLIKGRLIKLMNDKFEFAINSKSKQAAEKLTEYLNNLKLDDRIKIDSKVFDLQPNNIMIDNDNLILVIYAKGKIVVKIDLENIK